MRVAIDNSPLTSGHAVRGVGTYTRELIKALENETKTDKDNLLIEAFDFSSNKDKLTQGNYDLIHLTFFHPFFLTLPFRYLSKTVVTIHDLTPLLYPKYYPPGIKGGFIFWLQKQLVRRLKGIIAISETSKKDIVRLMNVDTKKISVVYEAPKDIFRKIDNSERLAAVKEKYKLPKCFILYVGDVNYNKNLVALADACCEIKTPLIIVGRQAVHENVDLTHPENRAFAELLRKYGNDPNVRRLGFVEDNDLVCLYNLATIYCQPSLYEGFALPILEAYTCETPVVAAKSQALVEIAGGAAYLFDLKVKGDLARKLFELKESYAKRLHFIREGSKRVKSYSWSKAAKETINVYKEIADSR